MKITKNDWNFIRYNVLFNLEKAIVRTEKDKWMHAHSQYLLDKLFKMKEKEERE